MERFQLRYENEVLGDPNRLAINALAPEFGREHKEFRGNQLPRPLATGPAAYGTASCRLLSHQKLQDRRAV